MSKKFKVLFGFFWLILVVAIGFVISISWDNAMFFVYTTTNRTYPQKTPADFGLAYEQITLKTEDGLELAAWYVPSQNGGAVIVQHGYRSNREEVLPIAEILARHGYGILMMDARAHGYSEGEMVTFGLKEVLDIRAGLDYLLQRPEVDPRRIGALGNSQGAVTLLLAMARYKEIRAYVGDSPYASLQDEVAAGVKSLTGLDPFPFAALIQFFAEREAGFRAEAVAPISHVPEIAPRPVFFLHGGKDLTVPPESGHQLYRAAGQPKFIWFDPELGHVEFLYQRPAEYERRVIGFFDQYLRGE